MVRKRTRRYSSDNDSDSDGGYSVQVEKKAVESTKKYSLRERKRRPVFSVNFDSEHSDLEEESSEKPPTEDDEDFEIEPLIGEPPEEAIDVKLPTRDELVDFEKLPNNEPIDFEDIIRADIVVVTKNKIEETHKERPRKRRGRKPKRFCESSSSESNSQSGTDDKSETVFREGIVENGISDAPKASHEDTSKDTTEPEINTNDSNAEKATMATNILEMPIIRLNSKIETSSKIDMLVTQNYILQNEADLDDNDGIEDTFDFDDDVIVIEPKHEIIVLDD